MRKAILSTIVLAGAAGSVAAQTAGNYATVNGLRIYYETHGAAASGSPPLILLQGGVGGIEMFGPNLPARAKNRRVIAVDLQGHGRTADVDRPFRQELMADDIAHSCSICASRERTSWATPWVAASLSGRTSRSSMVFLAESARRRPGWPGSSSEPRRHLPGTTQL